MALSNPFNPPPNTPLLPDPQRDSVWRRWFEQLWRRIQTGALGGTVTSVAVSGGTTGLTTSGGPITTSGTITLAGTLVEANGGTGETTYTDGQLLIGNTAGGLTKATLTAGTGITVTNGDGSITLDASGGTDLLIIYDNENLDIATNTQITGHAGLTFSGTGELIIAGTGSLGIL